MYHITTLKWNFFFLLILETLNIFITFLYKGTYFKCIKMNYITARETRRTRMPKINGKAYLK